MMNNEEEMYFVNEDGEISCHYDIEQMQSRMGKLSGGVAIIKIGAHSEIELNEKKDRVEDSLNATRAALDEGIIPGGGVALMWLCENPELNGTGNEVEAENTDQGTGIEIVEEACKQPFIMIMKNAGLEPEHIWNEVDEVYQKHNAESLTDDCKFGYNVKQ